MLYLPQRITGWLVTIITVSMSVFHLYVAFFGPSLLMIGEWHTIAATVVTATIGVTCLAAALHNYFFFGHTHIWERLFLFGAAFVLINPGLYTDVIGASLLGLAVASQLLLPRPEPKRHAPPVTGNQRSSRNLPRGMDHEEDRTRLAPTPCRQEWFGAWHPGQSVKLCCRA